MVKKHFTDIELTETFIYKDKMFFKIRGTEHMNACCLSDGEMYYFEGWEVVTTIDIAIVAVDKGVVEKMIRYGIPTINPNNIQHDIEECIQYANDVIDEYDRIQREMGDEL